jgi:hypothetical protein
MTNLTGAILMPPLDYALTLIDVSINPRAAFIRACRDYPNIPVSYMAHVGEELFRLLDGEEQEALPTINQEIDALEFEGEF